jgi:hypothetical protein
MSNSSRSESTRTKLSHRTCYMCKRAIDRLNDMMGVRLCRTCERFVRLMESGFEEKERSTLEQAQRTAKIMNDITGE